MFVVVRLQVGGIVLVIVRTMFIPMLVVMTRRIGTVAMLVRMRVLVGMAVLMGVLVGMRDATVRVFVGVPVLVRMVVLVGMFVLPFHSSPHSHVEDLHVASQSSIGQRALAVRGAQHAIHGIRSALCRFVEMPHLQLT